MLIGGDMFRLWGGRTDDGPIDQVPYVVVVVVEEN